ncbi:MAG: APC family permease [Thermoanaerobaculia bacterium]
MTAPEARRVVSRVEVLALSLNDVVGSGVYLLPAAAAAALAGSASLWGVALAGLAVLLIVLCFAEAASRFDEPGGAYVYAREAWGDLAGFEVGWMTFLTRVATLASLSAGFAQALSWAWPAAAGGAGRAAAIALPLIVLTAINVKGVKEGARASAFLLVAKLVPLALFVGAGLFAVRWSRVAAPARVDPAGLGEVALLLLFAYAGFENTAAPAGEYRNPKRDVPFALVTQIVLVTLIYALVQLVALGTLPDLAASRTPLADAARLFLGGWGGALLTAGAAASILGTAGNTVLSGPRYLYALAVDGYGPAFLGRLHPRFLTPAAAIVVQTAVVLPLALTGSFAGLAALSVVARLASYVSTAAAIPVLRRKLPDTPATVRLPFGPAIPVAAVAVSAFLVASATALDLVAGAGALVAGLVVYALRRKGAAGDGGAAGV